MPFLDEETVLPDDYPVNYYFIYIADGKLIRSNLGGDNTVLDLKRLLNVKEVRRCEMFHEDRNRMKIGDVVSEG